MASSVTGTGWRCSEFETLVDPLGRSSPFNTRIHGFTGDHIIGAPTFGEVHAAVSEHLSGRITVAHSFFDKGALGAAYGIHRTSVGLEAGMDFPRPHAVCG
ncbi:MAG: hypothetical protein ACRYG8_53460 [Janthinobacterium lividum]